ncbi:MAG: mechanosensitive ion channel domain-containing protein [Chloroflexota bacterium]|nr:mechanosensitive ion channel [Chloroflexota bacterium]
MKSLDYAFLWGLLEKTLLALVVLLIFYFGGRLARRGIARIASRSSRNANLAALLSNLTYAGFVILALVTILTIYTGAGLSSLLTLLGILSLAISLSIQDVLKNFVAGVYILMEQPFKIGDRISLKGVEGIVESIEIRTTNLRTDEGIQIIIPNGTVFTEVIVNRSAYERSLATVRVTLPSSHTFKEATAQISQILTTLESQDVMQKPEPSLVLENVTDGKKTFRVEFWTRQGTAHLVAPRVAVALQQQLPEADVSVAGPKSLTV